VIRRDRELATLRHMLRAHPVVGLIGARQVGKTTLARSVHTAMEDLKFKRLDIVHAGEHSFPLARRVRAVALRRLLDDIQPLS
jgi:predicted AAA+ superfamily ATPase